jgi:hypothetical protein
MESSLRSRTRRRNLLRRPPAQSTFKYRANSGSNVVVEVAVVVVKKLNEYFFIIKKKCKKMPFVILFCIHLVIFSN